MKNTKEILLFYPILQLKILALLKIKSAPNWRLGRPLFFLKVVGGDGVAASILVYNMSTFKIPKTLADRLESCDFWWNGTDNSNARNQIAWDKICKAEGLGGLGFTLLAHEPGFVSKTFLESY